jgi:hypothetical protein
MRISRAGAVACESVRAVIGCVGRYICDEFFVDSDVYLTLNICELSFFYVQWTCI